MMVPTSSPNYSSVSCDFVRLDIDLNEDQNHHDDYDPFTPPNYLDQQGSSYYREQQPKHLPSHDEKAEKIIGSSGSLSWDHYSAANTEDGSSSSNIAGKGNPVYNYFQDQQQEQRPLSPLIRTHNSSSNITVTVRVCSDCHTTKTPLWRSGPCGPKSLCNACGIRQRKARRAAAMAAAETCVKGGNNNKKFGNKDNKSKIECTAPQPQLKKKRKQSQVADGRKNKLGFKDLTLMRLSKNFPHDEIKEAAILLMALSYGLVDVHG